MTQGTDFPFESELTRKLASGEAKRGDVVDKPPVKGWAVTCAHLGTTLVPAEDEVALRAAIADVTAKSPNPACVHWHECWVHFQERWGPFVVDRMYQKPR